METRKFDHCELPAGVRHRRKVPFRPAIACPPDTRPRLQRIKELDDELDRVILRGDDYLDLVTEAWSSNVHASTSIEGNPLPLEEVRRTTRNAFEGYVPSDAGPYRQEILNHAWLWVEPGAFETPWSLSLIQEIHKTLLTGVDETSQPGAFREGGEPSTVTGPEGQVWFHTAPGDQVEEELEELLRWLNHEGPAFDPLIAGAVFFHEFESIHPFEDGNGRTGRVLFHTYLQTNGLPNAHKCMIERGLTEDPALYYRILGWTDHAGSYTDLIDFFIDATLESYEAAVTRFSEKDLLTTGVEENAKRLLVQAKRHGDWFTVRDASKWVEGRSDATIRSYLRHWEQEGAIETRGRTSGKRYRFRNPLEGLLERLESQ